MKIIDDIRYFDSNIDFNHWIKSYHKHYSESEINPTNMQLLLNYITARIDIKNKNSSDNSIEIIEISDKTADVSYPKWFNNSDGIGLVLTSKTGEMNFKCKCINDGKLTILLRGIDIRDKNNNRFPIYINFLEFNINNQNILENDVLVSHDNPYTFSKNVVNSEIFDVHLKWQPFSKSCVYK